MVKKMAIRMVVLVLVSVGVYVYIELTATDPPNATALERCVSQKVRLVSSYEKPAAAITFLKICEQELRNN